MATFGGMCVRSANNVSKNLVSLMLNRNSQVSCSRLRYYSGATETNNKKSEGTESKQKETESPSEDSKVTSDVEAKLTEEKDKLEQQVKDFKRWPSMSFSPSIFEKVKILLTSRKNLQDKHLRALAETENVRKRMAKQVEDMRKFGIQGFCKDLLEVADILNKATESVPKEELNNKNPHLKNLYDGLCMTEQQLQKVFGKHGLEKINPKEGDVFDPNVHEALFQVPTPDKEKDSQVADIQKIGYKLHERTIRPALVGVFKA